jgi:hypothetical protein
MRLRTKDSARLAQPGTHATGDSSMDAQG